METVVTDAPRLMAMAAATESRHNFSKRLHVADIKNIAGDDQTTQRVENFRKYRAVH